MPSTNRIYGGEKIFLTPDERAQMLRGASDQFATDMTYLPRYLQEYLAPPAPLTPGEMRNPQPGTLEQLRADNRQWDEFQQGQTGMYQQGRSLGTAGALVADPLNYMAEAVPLVRGAGRLASMVAREAVTPQGLRTMTNALTNQRGAITPRGVKGYHGSTRLNGDWFSNEKLGSNTIRYDDTGLGHFVSTNPKVANEFAGYPIEDVYSVSTHGQEAAGLKAYKNKGTNKIEEGGAVYPVKVNLSNPYEMTASQYRKTFFDDYSVDVNALRDGLIAQGYDGIKIKGDPRSDWGELRATNYIAFDADSYKPWFESGKAKK